jgi:hypothetical protein
MCFVHLRDNKGVNVINFTGDMSIFINYKILAASGKRQAASGKRQAASGKRQAASGKLFLCFLISIISPIRRRFLGAKILLLSFKITR